MSIVGEVWVLTRWNLLRFAWTIAVLWWLPVKNYWTILAVLILGAAGFADYDTWKGLFKNLWFTWLFFTVIYFAYWLFGGLWGVVGIAVAGMLVLFAMLAYTLYNNWKVYDAVTTWGAERIRGKHKRDFDLRKVLEDDKCKTKKKN